MERRTELLKYISPEQKGMEIGPYFNPLVPKSAGWDVLVLDVLDADQLRLLAKADPNIPDERIDEIEDVDLVGPAHRVAELAEASGVAPGSLDFVISSHNFEHLPDPIRFLQAVTRLLRPGGVLSMAVPDCRYCFDALRPPSTTGAMLEAFLEARERPSPRQEFEQWALFASCERADGTRHGHFIDTGRDATPVLDNALAPLMARWRARLDTADAGYPDVHCWTLTPAVFAAIIADLRSLDLCDFEAEDISSTNELEFFVHLRRPVTPAPPAKAERQAAYKVLLHEFQDGSLPRPSMAVPVPMGRKAMVKALILGTPLLGPAARAIRRLVRPR